MTTFSAHGAPGPTRQLAAWASQLALEDVPGDVQERAKHLLLDGFGCALIGAQLPWSRTAVDAVLAFEGDGDRVLIGWDRTTSAPAAALLNGTFIQGFELDDFHPFAPLHSASLIVPALLAAAPIDGSLTGGDFVRAMVVGFEVGPRVGLALHGGEMLTRGWHSGSVFGPIAAAAAVGNLLGLDVDRMEHALGLGATQACGLMAAQFGAMSKRMHHGFAARNGLYAALLARGGYTGIEGVFEQQYGGYLSTFGEGHNPDVTQITDGLGHRWETERIVVKPYAAMGGLHAALDALLDIVRTHDIRAVDVERIDVDLSEAVYHHGWWPPVRPLTSTGAQMNVGYALAVALIDGEALAQQFSPSRIDQDDVWEIVPRITAHHRAQYDELGSMGRGQTEVRVTMRDGSVHMSSQFAARSILEPLTNTAVVDKFRDLTADSVEGPRQDALIGAITHLEQQPNLEFMHHLLAPIVRSPFETTESPTGA
jgi:2-methylcitrate dehydratase PrpD